MGLPETRREAARLLASESRRPPLLPLPPLLPVPATGGVELDGPGAPRTGKPRASYSPHATNGRAYAPPSVARLPPASPAATFFRGVLRLLRRPLEEPDDGALVAAAALKAGAIECGAGLRLCTIGGSPPHAGTSAAPSAAARGVARNGLFCSSECDRREEDGGVTAHASRVDGGGGGGVDGAPPSRLASLSECSEVGLAAGRAMGLARTVARGVTPGA